MSKSKSRSEQKYEELKAYYREKASVKEKELHMDLLAVRHEYVPHHLKRKFLTGLGIFGTVYLVEKLIFGKRIPRIVRFTSSLSAIVFAPKVYRLLEDRLLGIGEMEPLEMEMLEDQQLNDDAPSDTHPPVTNDPGTSQDIAFPEKPFPVTTASELSAEGPAPDIPPSSSAEESNLPHPPADTGQLEDDSNSKNYEK